MALIMNDEQRAKALEEYNPREHLIEVAKDKKGPVFYYPAAWRLYELRLRYPFFTLEAEIIHMDEEKGTVIVKAIGYDGFDYASSNLKGTALKQGPLKELDKVETKAKSRMAPLPGNQRSQTHRISNPWPCKRCSPLPRTALPPLNSIGPLSRQRPNLTRFQTMR